MNRLEALALAVAVLETVRFILGSGELAFRYYASQMPGAALPLGLAGWVLFTYGPMVTALLFLRMATRLRHPWIAHLIVLPAALLIAWTGDAIMLTVIRDPDFDTTLGAPEFPGMMLFAAGLVGYSVTLIVGLAKGRVRQRPNK